MNLSNVHSIKAHAKKPSYHLKFLNLLSFCISYYYPMLCIFIQSVSQEGCLFITLHKNEYNINIYIFFPALKIESISFPFLLCMQTIEVLYCFTK